MPPSYRTIAAPAEDEFIEKKSRFIGYIAPVTTEQEATAFIESVRARHREARHNCYAYRLRQNNLARFSDDGEPRVPPAAPFWRSSSGKTSPMSAWSSPATSAGSCWGPAAWPAPIPKAAK